MANNLSKVLEAFTNAKFMIYGVWDGEVQYNAPVNAEEIVNSVEESRVYLKRGENKVTLCLMNCSRMDECVSDFGASKPVWDEVMSIVRNFK